MTGWHSTDALACRARRLGGGAASRRRRAGELEAAGARSRHSLGGAFRPRRRRGRATGVLDFEGDLEIGALVGNITRLDGEPFVHAHVVVGGRDTIAHTGHLMAARCAATVELFLHDFGGAIHRAPDPAIGLNLCQL
jgi:predicted DNA-binding protein with PD1-like motif